jgi:hypothetical protein
LELLIPPQATFNGIPIAISPILKDEPKLKLSDSIQLSDNFRKEMNDWLAKTFGYNVKFYNINGTIVTTKAGYNMLKRASANNLFK